MEKGILYRPERTAIILNKTTCGCLIVTQLCKLDTGPEREVDALKMSVSRRGEYSESVGIQVTVYDSNPFLQSGLKGQVQKG